LVSKQRDNLLRCVSGQLDAPPQHVAKLIEHHFARNQLVLTKKHGA
jgi:hypothetical protein